MVNIRLHRKGRDILAVHNKEKFWNISKQMNQSDTRGYNSTLLRFQEDELYSNSNIATGWTQEHCQHLDSFLLIDFSQERLRERSVSEMKTTNTLGINGQ